MAATGIQEDGQKGIATCVLENITTKRKNAAISAKNVASVGHIEPQIAEEEEKETWTATRTKDTADPKAKKSSQTTEHSDGKALLEEH